MPLRRHLFFSFSFPSSSSSTLEPPSVNSLGPKFWSRPITPSLGLFRVSLVLNSSSTSPFSTVSCFACSVLAGSWWCRDRQDGGSCCGPPELWWGSSRCGSAISPLWPGPGFLPTSLWPGAVQATHSPNSQHFAHRLCTWIVGSLQGEWIGRKLDADRCSNEVLVDGALGDFCLFVLEVGSRSGFFGQLKRDGVVEESEASASWNV